MARPPALRVPPLTTYLLHSEGEPSDVLARFIERVQAIESPEAPRPKSGHHSDSLEDPDARRNASEGQPHGSEYPNGGGMVANPERLKNCASNARQTVQARRRAEQQGGRGHVQAVL